MAPDPIVVNVTRREHARNRAKRYARFLTDATVGLIRVRRRRKERHEAVHAATATRDRYERSVKDLRAQLVDGKPNPQLDGEIATAERRARKAQERINGLVASIEDDNAQIQKLKRRAKRAVTKRRHFLKRARFFAVKVRHFKKLREQREKEQPTFEPWMANGADYKNASEGAKAFIARAVVLHGLTCTSMARTFVPPGGSTSSYHLVWNGGRAGDAAGSQDRMEACQRAEYERGKGLTGQLEMFGPNNSLNLKFGDPLVQAEGSANEDLHDSHVHAAETDEAVEAAIRDAS